MKERIHWSGDMSEVGLTKLGRRNETIGVRGGVGNRDEKHASAGVEAVSWGEGICWKEGTLEDTQGVCMWEGGK